MRKSSPWQLMLHNYRYSSVPEQRQRSAIWQAAIGLQGVDGLNPSSYFVCLVEKHIQGKYSLKALEKRLYRYYRWHKNSPDLSQETWEADLVSLHIAELIQKPGFHFSPRELRRIHHSLFKDVYDFAGDFRDYDIRKKEWVLKGSSVPYLDHRKISQALTEEFGAERIFSYDGLTGKQLVRHLSRFIARVWLIHPYGEGNTRTTALFLIRYLQSLGYSMELSVFLDAWYFRNSLVRANYLNSRTGVSRDYRYLEQFLGNLLLKEENPLQNQRLHVDYPNL